MVQRTFTNLCQVETRRFLFVIGLLFAVVVVFQYFEFPYGTALPSSFFAAKLPVFGKSNLQSGDSQSNLQIVGNMSLSNDSNHASTDAFTEMAANNTKSSSVFVAEGKGSTSNGSDFGLDHEDKSDAKESSYINQAEQNRTSITVLGHEDSQKETSTSVTSVPKTNLRPKVRQWRPPRVVYSISEINNMFLQSRASYYSVVFVKLELQWYT